MRGRSRRRATVLLVGALSVASCGDDGPSSAPTTAGTPAAGSEPTATTAPRVPPVGAYGAGWSEIGAGIGYLELVADGTGRVLSFGLDFELSEPREDRFTYEVAGDRLTVTSGSGAAWECDPTEPGTYEWVLAGAVLELDPIDEPCSERAVGIQAVADWEWYSLGDAPIVEAGPGDAPVLVDTLIGTIAWTVVGAEPTPPTTDSSDDVTPPPDGEPGRVQVWALDSGFLARTGPEASGTYWTSTDGRTWAELVDAPSGLSVQATFGDSVYGTVGLDDDVTSNDGGRTWQAAADRPGNGPGDLLAVGDVGFVAIETAIFGPCVGVVFVSADGTTWQRALNPWPPPAMNQPVISGDSIVIPAIDSCGSGKQIQWVGTVD